MPIGLGRPLGRMALADVPIPVGPEESGALKCVPVPFDAMSFDPRESFGPRVAAAYDDGLRGDEDAAVAFLSKFGGPALEFAIGTGRIALPLAATGVRVDGVELS